jgi:N-acyl-D-aspartate/D-glutamate deacylase
MQAIAPAATYRPSNAEEGVAGMGDLLITDGLLIDGTGAAGIRQDVRVSGGRIVELGDNLAPRGGERVIAAEGAVVAPGFIDSHTHFDATIYWDPHCDPMPLHGVTSVVFGNCALSLAPIRAEDRADQLDVFSFIEDLPLDLLNEAIPWAWESFDEYARSLATAQLGINVCGFVGHSQIRCYMMGENAWSRAATESEIARMAEMLDQTLASGALGMSYSLFDKDKSGRPVPSCLADDAEIESLFAVLAKHRALFQFVLPGNTTEAIFEHLDWLASFLERHDVAALYNVVVHVNADPERSSKVLGYLEALHARGVRLYGMATPRPFELQVSFMQTIAFIHAPAWNELVQAPLEGKRRMAADPDWRARAKTETDACTSVTFPFYRPEMLRIGTVGQEALSDWAGRPLVELMEERGGHLVDIVADWLIENDFDTTLIFPIANTDADHVAKILRSPATLVSGSDAGAHLQMFCAAGDTTLLLTRHVAERADLSLEAAVHQLTAKQAEVLALSDRGIIAPGKAADIVIFRLDELHYGGQVLAHDVPGGRPRLTREPGGYRYTIINGVVVQEGGKTTGALPAGWLPRRA